MMVAAGCARQPVVRPPDGLDYVTPGWSGLDPELEERLERAWRRVLTGDAEAAASDYRKLLRRQPGLRPARVGLAYAEMRAGQHRAARARFEDVLVLHPDDLAALMGAGTLAVRDGEAAVALELYARAASLAPGDRLVARRLQEATAQVVEARVGAARAALSAGLREEAVTAYRSALELAPEVGGVRVALAGLLHGGGDSAAAVELLEAAPVRDRQVLDRLAQLHVQTGELHRALETFRVLLEIDPEDAELRRRADDVRRELELLQMPEPYREIPGKERITRADLAALIAIKVTALARLEPPPPRVVTDASGSWAERYVQQVANLDVLSVYPNHTFQPHATVRRDELAHAVGRVLDLLGFPEDPAPELRDVRPSHLYYRGVTRAVAAGLMDVTPGGAFEGWRPVSGPDAVAVVEALARAVGP